MVQHHGVHNLDKKQENLKINQSNKNDILRRWIDVKKKMKDYESLIIKFEE